MLEGSFPRPSVWFASAFFLKIMRHRRRRPHPFPRVVLNLTAHILQSQVRNSAFSVARRFLPKVRPRGSSRSFVHPRSCPKIFSSPLIPSSFLSYASWHGYLGPGTPKIVKVDIFSKSFCHPFTLTLQKLKIIRLCKHIVSWKSELAEHFSIMCEFPTTSDNFVGRF